MILTSSRKTNTKREKTAIGSGMKAEHKIMLLAFVCAFFCLLIGFGRTPRLYAVDHGQYKTIMDQCGLTWTAEDLEKGDLQYVRPVTDFSYMRFNWADLLTPDAGFSIVYPVSLVRLFTEPFGLNFSVDALAVVFCIMLLLSVVVMALALYRLAPAVWYIPLIFSCVLFTDGNFCAMFRGLYNEGAAIAFSMLYLAVLLEAWSLPKERRGKRLPLVLICSFMLIKSVTPMIVFLPAIVTEFICMFLSCRKQMKTAFFWAAGSVIVLYAFTRSSLDQALNDADYFSNASVYESVFDTMLTCSETPEKILSELGLDESYLEDIGNSFYEEESEYVHNPRDEEEAERLFSSVTTADVVKTYLRHPFLMIKVLENVPADVKNGFENIWNLQRTKSENGFSASRVGSGILSIIWRFLPVSYTAFFILLMAALLVCVAAAVHFRRKTWLRAILFILGFILFFPFAVFLNGYALCHLYVRCQVLFTIILYIAGICAIVGNLPFLRVWLNRYRWETYTPAIYDRREEHDLYEGDIAGNTLHRLASAIFGTRKKTVILTAAVSFVMLIMAFGLRPHVVSVNNGDYGRMMVQMDLVWTGMDYYDTGRQAGHMGIEEYHFTEPFDPLKLTPIHPTYSLYWFVSIVRLLTEPFQRTFSTLLLGWVMGLISLGCVLKILWDLYPLLKKWTVVLAAVLSSMIFSETYLVWFNSMFGEGCILVGLLLILMCSVHLCMMEEERGPRRILWLAGLSVSLYILIAAKSQMLLALPGALLLMLFFIWYRRPYRYDLQALQGVVALVLCIGLVWGGLGVYQSDRTDDSVSQKHTMWQAYFYGIFMISDDPIGDMEDLGIDTAMAADIGKFVQFDNDDMYVYAPLSDEAQTAFYDHVSMLTIVKWYITHPLKLWKMLDYAASESRELYTGFRVYSDQDYSDPEHDDVKGRNLWPGWRKYLSPGSFLGYVFVLGGILFLSLRGIFRRGTSVQKKLLLSIPVFLILTAALQFPLSVLGNGFADNQKQLFCFALCYDLLLGGAVVLGARYLMQNQDNIRIMLQKLGQNLKESRYLKHTKKREGEAYDPETDPVDHNSLL